MQDKSEGNVLEVSLKDGCTVLKLNGVEVNDVLGYNILGSAEKGFTELNLSVVISAIKTDQEVPVQEQFKQVGLPQQILLELQKIHRIMERHEEYVNILKGKQVMNIKNNIKLNARSGENIDDRDIKITFQEVLKAYRQCLQE